MHSIRTKKLPGKKSPDLVHEQMFATLRTLSSAWHSSFSQHYKNLLYYSLPGTRRRLSCPKASDCSLMRRRRLSARSYMNLPESLQLLTSLAELEQVKWSFPICTLPEAEGICAHAKPHGVHSFLRSQASSSELPRADPHGV